MKTFLIDIILEWIHSIPTSAFMKKCLPSQLVKVLPYWHFVVGPVQFVRYSWEDFVFGKKPPATSLRKMEGEEGGGGSH